VNSIYAEYYPTVTVSDNILVFTRAGEHLREDFMESNMSKKGFSLAKPIAGDINIEPKKERLLHRKMATGFFLQDNFLDKVLAIMIFINRFILRKVGANQKIWERILTQNFGRVLPV